MAEFVSIIIIVFGLLQIILFFKVWGMTNKVSAIKLKLEENSLYTAARKAYVLGDLVKAKALLDECYAEGVILVKQTSAYGGEYETKFNDLNDRYTKVYKKMGIEMPDLSKFGKMNTIPS